MVARDRGRFVGFGALLPRRVSTTAGEVVIYVATFVAVDPDYRGAGIGTELIRRRVELSDRPILSFTRPASQSERGLIRSVAWRGWTYRRVATLQTYVGGLAGNGQPPAVARLATAEEFLSVTRVRGRESIAWNRPTLAQCQHYATDPRGACLAIAEGMDGTALGAALIVRAEIRVTADSSEHVPSLDVVYLHDQHAAALTALRRFALEHWEGASVVTAPNLVAVPAAAVRQAGFRSSRSVFNVSVLGDPAELFTNEIVSTNLEVF